MDIRHLFLIILAIVLIANWEVVSDTYNELEQWCTNMDDQAKGVTIWLLVHFMAIAAVMWSLAY